MFTSISNNITNQVPTWKSSNNPTLITFKQSPLSIICAMMDLGTNASDIVQSLAVNGSYSTVIVTDAHQQLASKIYKYFSNKNTMRRMQDKFVSEWMLIIDQLCENPLIIDPVHLPVLVTLVRFYHENLELDFLTKSYNSVKLPLKHVIYNAVNTVKFITRIERRAKLQIFDLYYFKTPEQELLRVSVPSNNIGNSAWKFIVKHPGLIKFNSEYSRIENINGYDFYVYSPGPLTEIELL